METTVMDEGERQDRPGGSPGAPRVAWVFAAGPEAAVPPWPWLPRPDLVIAADGGLAHALDLGLVPTLALGDFDSLEPATLQAFAAAHPEATIRHYVHELKVETDAELGVIAAVEAGASEIVLTGVLGGRWDHSFANLLLLTHPLLAHVPTRLVTADTEIVLLRGHSIRQIGGRPGDLVSLVPLDTAEGITLSGLQYPLLEETLYAGQGRGVSNVLTHRLASVSVRRGLLWVIVTHQPTDEEGR
ncbi:MAG TPA: thiamine diphosphokinase [Chloroflexia bacterium]|nr:thiamine diphosphokinase [Chloroflexia bacterium]